MEQWKKDGRKYEAHTACDSKGFVLDIEVTAGNVHDSVAWDKLYDSVTGKYEVEFVTIDAGYKIPWIAKKTLDDGKIPILPYTRYKGKKDKSISRLAVYYSAVQGVEG